MVNKKFKIEREENEKVCKAKLHSYVKKLVWMKIYILIELQEV